MRAMCAARPRRVRARRSPAACAPLRPPSQTPADPVGQVLERLCAELSDHVCVRVGDAAVSRGALRERAAGRAWCHVGDGRARAGEPRGAAKYV